MRSWILLFLSIVFLATCTKEDVDEESTPGYMILWTHYPDYWNNEDSVSLGVSEYHIDSNQLEISGRWFKSLQKETIRLKIKLDSGKIELGKKYVLFNDSAHNGIGEYGIFNFDGHLNLVLENYSNTTGRFLINQYGDSLNYSQKGFVIITSIHENRLYGEFDFETGIENYENGPPYHRRCCGPRVRGEFGNTQQDQ